VLTIFSQSLTSSPARTSTSESTPKRSRKRESAPVGPKTKKSRISKKEGLLDNIEDLLELSKRQQTQEELWKMLDEGDTKNSIYISDGDMEIESKHVRRRGKGTIDQSTVLEEYVERPGEERGKKFRKQRIKGDSDKDLGDVTIEYIPNKFKGKGFENLYCYSSHMISYHVYVTVHRMPVFFLISSASFHCQHEGIPEIKFESARAEFKKFKF